MRALPNTIAALVLVLATAGQASAADLTVLCSTGFKAVLDELAAEFERASGDRVAISYGVSTALKQQIDRGAAFDVTILTPAQIDALVAQRIVVADTRVELARTKIVIGMRRGGHRVDVGTVDALKEALLRVRSIAYAKDGAGGLYFAGVAKRLGIADALAAKTTFAANGEQVARTVARGDAEFGIQPLSEILPHPDLEVLGTFPASLEGYAVMVGGVAATSRNAPAARAFLAFFTAPSVLPVLTHKGMERH